MYHTVAIDFIIPEAVATWTEVTWWSRISIWVIGRQQAASFNDLYAAVFGGTSHIDDDDCSFFTRLTLIISIPGGDLIKLSLRADSLGSSFWKVGEKERKKEQ